MEQDLLGRFKENFQGAMELVFPDRMFPTELNSCSISLKPSLIHVSDFCGRFTVNATDL